MKNVVIVGGARPNFMKIAPLIRSLRDRASLFIKPFFVFSGQHKNKKMSESFFKELGLPNPSASFNIPEDLTSFGKMGQISTSLENYFIEFLKKDKIDLVIVVGDVDSSMISAIVSKRFNLPLAHVEAGLRSYDLSMPEENNRKVIDTISDYFFCSEEYGVENLSIEGKNKNVFFVGNVMIDNLVHCLKSPSLIKPPEEKKYIYITLHRPSNVDNKDRLAKIIEQLDKFNLELYLSCHPRLEKKLKEFSIKSKNIKFIDPLPYKENIEYIRHAKCIVTDSGGIQEESSFLNVPCFTLRNNTERPSTIKYGTNNLISIEDLEEEYILSCCKNYDNFVCSIPLWDGKASERIVDILLRVL